MKIDMHSKNNDKYERPFALILYESETADIVCESVGTTEDYGTTDPWAIDDNE